MLWFSDLFLFARASVVPALNDNVTVFVGLDRVSRSNKTSATLASPSIDVAGENVTNWRQASHHWNGSTRSN